MVNLPQGKENQDATSNGTKRNKNKRYWKAARVIAIFGIIEGISLVLWCKSEDFLPYPAYFIRWIADCGFLAGCAFLAHKLTGGKYKNHFKALIWIVWAILCAVMFIARSKPEQPSNALLQETNPPTNSQSKPIEEQIGYYSKLASARQWQPPELPRRLLENPMGVLVLVKFGGMTTLLPVGTNGWHSIQPIGWEGGEDFIPYIKDNRLYIKTKTTFGEELKTVEMNNEWPSTIPDGWDRNFNERSFEIVDDKQLPVFQIRYDSPNEIELYGIFVASDGSVTVAFGDSTDHNGSARLPVPAIPERKAWFKYPSKDHLGELAGQ